MIITLIVAMDEKRGIGYQNRIPWRLSEDLRFFKTLTMGHYLIAGRKTYEAVGRALPGRTMIVITRQGDYAENLPETVLTARSLEQALSTAEQAGEDEVFVIGGSEIYRQALPAADRIYLTRVKASVLADVFFPDFDESEWQGEEILYHDADEKNQYSFSTQRLERKRRM